MNKIMAIILQIPYPTSILFPYEERGKERWRIVKKLLKPSIGYFNNVTVLWNSGVETFFFLNSRFKDVMVTQFFESINFHEL